MIFVHYFHHYDFRHVGTYRFTITCRLLLSLCVKNERRCSRKCYLFRSVSVVGDLFGTCRRGEWMCCRILALKEMGNHLYQHIQQTESWIKFPSCNGVDWLLWMNINGAFKLNWNCKQRWWFSHVEKRTVFRRQIILMHSCTCLTE